MEVRGVKLECPVCGHGGVKTWSAGPYVVGFYARVLPHDHVSVSEGPTFRVERCPGSDGPPRATW